jgi:hypothetical protein
MGQQQLLLIVIGVVIVGISTLIGISLFGAMSVEENKDAIVNDITILSSNAFQYYCRPNSMSGGNFSYSGYTIPVKLQSTENATYSIVGSPASNITLKGTSVNNTTNTVTVTLGTDGKPVSGSWSFGGEFQ